MKKIVWLLSLILCLATFFISPSAQADQTWDMYSTYLKFEGGDVYNGYNIDTAKWNLNDGTGERKFIAHVSFKDPYTVPPDVIVSLTGLDVANYANERLTVTPINVTPKGFDVEYKTWADTRVYSLWANWVAFGE
jgi:hypothetical protein